MLNGKEFLAEDRGIQYNKPHIYLDSKKREDKASFNKIKFIKTTFFNIFIFNVIQLSALTKYAIYYHHSLHDPFRVQ